MSRSGNAALSPLRRSAASGELNGFQVTHRELTLSPDGNSTTAEITVERYDAAGTLVGTGCASTVGSRIF
jgi:hypothetical protein